MNRMPGFSTIRRPRRFPRLCAGSWVMLALLILLWIHGTLFCSALVLQHWSYPRKSFERFERLYVGAGIILVDYERSDFVRYGWTQAEIDDYYTGVMPGWHFRHFTWESQYRNWGWERPYFTRYHGGSYIRSSPDGEFHLIIPLWLLLPLCGIMPLAQWRFRCRKRARERRGLCVACGYDLRATPEKCPECGIEPTKALQADRSIFRLLSARPINEA